MFAGVHSHQWTSMRARFFMRLANKFKVKSQSTGSGEQRRPTLYRTKQTTTYAEDEGYVAIKHIEAAATRIGRKYFPRTDANGRSGQGIKTPTRGRSGGKAVTYQEGEIVGATAPELGQENKGRAMLEKMGWSKGMALGAFENQGILEPVAQVVETLRRQASANSRYAPPLRVGRPRRLPSLCRCSF